jgi:signal peptidase I
MPHTIVEEAPSQYDDSDIINALGAQPGDIIYMPDGRVLRYIPGGTGSRGNEYHYTTVKEYDRHDSDVKQQHNVPDKTYTKKEKREGTKVYTRPGQNSSEHKRNPNDWYPRIVPITNGKNNR